VKSTSLADTATYVVVAVEEEGEVHRMEEDVTNVAGEGEREEPNMHVDEVPKSDPETVTVVPPEMVPAAGKTDETVARGTYVNVSEAPTKSSPSLDTRRGMGDADVEKGDTHTTEVEDTKPATTSVLPKRHVRESACSKLEPVTVTDVPPPTGPEEGKREETAATSVKVKGRAAEEYSAPFTDTSRETVEPAASAGDVHSTWVEEMYLAEAEGVDPNLHLRSMESAKSKPDTSTLVPPVTGPTVGEREVGVAEGRYLKCVEDEV
jgi:hypothetical protein